MTKARDIANSTTTLDVDGTIKLDGNYPVGTGNVALGDQAFGNASSGNYNVAIGETALYNNTASSNTAVGRYALVTNTSGGNNVAIGRDALVSNTTASNNTTVGYQAGYSTTTGNANTFIGRETGKSHTTGVSNTFVGANGGDLITTGSANTIIGRYQGNNGGLDIRTLSNYIVLSDGDSNPRAWHDGTQWNEIANFEFIGETSMNGATQVAFDSFPSWATDILLVIDSPGLSSNSETQIQLRSSGANIGSGYRSWLKNMGGSGFTTQGQFTGSHRVYTTNSTNISGQIRVVKVRDGATDYWTIQSIVISADNDTLGIGVGSLQTASTVNGIRIYSNNGTSTFTGGYARCYVKG